MKHFYVFILLLASLPSLAQSQLEQGVLASIRYDYDNLFDVQKFRGFGIEGGYYFLKKFEKRGILSLDIRLAYAHSEGDTKNSIEYPSSLPDPLIRKRAGTVVYNNLSIALPIRYRWRFKPSGSVYLMIGYSPIFNIYNHSEWLYNEFEIDTTTDTILSEKSSQKSTLKQRFYTSESSAGLGFIKNKQTYELSFNSGSMNIDNKNYPSFLWKKSIGFNFYQKLD